MNWCANVGVPPLLPGVVQVWRLRLGSPELQPLLAPGHAALSLQERERATRMRAGAPREEYMAARGALRMLLGALLNEPADRIRFVLGPQGKPALAEGGIHFNVTHSGGCILLALSSECAVGIDIEPLDRKVEALDLARAHFHPHEAAAIAAAPDEPTRMALFFRCWTRKEAVVKADGRGLQLPLASFCVLAEDENVPVELPGSKPMWVHDLAVHPGFAAALAFPNQDQKLLLLDLTAPLPL